MFRFLGRRRTFESVAQELIRGFEDGSIVLELPEEEAELCAPAATQYQQSQIDDYAIQNGSASSYINPQTLP